MIRVTVTRADDSVLEFDAVKAPWIWRGFLAIDQGLPGHMTYVPLDSVESFDLVTS